MVMIKLLHWRTKKHLNCAYMNLIVRFEYETFSSTQRQEKRLQCFERKIHGPQCGAVKFIIS
ncbi:Reverse transcriptase domain-containing protein [Aphis craccivora]|uniref:Reverse transcriptase domain-containing protein n=1 Tax=Aphis craccivora TaxID=307492 RepID=A0A6G0VX60_APHCR|nr:Reverse transcriptase domain-containing protein [Aphis craccivora]